MAALSARTALVTGGSRGMGLEIARQLLARGASVAITGRTPEALSAAEQELDSERLLCVPANAGEIDRAEDVVAGVLERFGSLDLLVNNVGISPYFGPLVDAPAAAVMKTFEVNVGGALAMIQAAWTRRMREHGGAVVNVASIASVRTAANLGVYALTKAALRHLTMQLSAELAPTVRVNAIAPAIIKTRFSEARYDGREEELLERYPMGRLGVPEDVAPAVCFLLSDDASWITGETLAVDGGALKVDTG
ncbi:MAG: short-chain dehydrogenase/reductase [Conexibacter sp.]|nr:short-chain dehydrogenase/reductase [Conexibacter sp.]